MKQSWDLNQLFEELIDQIEYAINLPATRNTPYIKDQITKNAYHIVFFTGLFHDECKAWKKKVASDQTWANFKTEFTIAQQELRSSHMAAHLIGYHGQENMAKSEECNQDSTEALDAIAQLANAATTDKTIIMTVTKKMPSSVR